MAHGCSDSVGRMSNGTSTEMLGSSVSTWCHLRGGRTEGRGDAIVSAGQTGQASLGSSTHQQGGVYIRSPGSSVQVNGSASATRGKRLRSSASPASHFSSAIRLLCGFGSAPPAGYRLR